MPPPKIYWKYAHKTFSLFSLHLLSICHIFPLRKCHTIPMKHGQPLKSLWTLSCLLPLVVSERRRGATFVLSQHLSRVIIMYTNDEGKFMFFGSTNGKSGPSVSQGLLDPSANVWAWGVWDSNLHLFFQMRKIALCTYYTYVRTTQPGIWCSCSSNPYIHHSASSLIYRGCIPHQSDTNNQPILVRISVLISHIA